jgi:hypothetical protein
MKQALTSHHEARLHGHAKALKASLFYNATVGILNASSVPAHNMRQSSDLVCFEQQSQIHEQCSTFNPLAA